MKLTESDKGVLQSLKEYAEKHPYHKEDMMELFIGRGVIPGDVPEFHRLILGGSCKVVLTHEWQPLGLCRHASFSFSKDANYTEETCSLVLKELGFNDTEMYVYFDDETIFNAIQLI